MRLFKRILIANRGEIACRVIRSCRKLGIETVAVYSDPDAHALHVQQADFAVRLGPAEASQSYLNTKAIIEACLATGAEAVHPGYGFLSENPAFVDALTEAGITFIGPPSSAISAMGLKDAAKALMEKAGVPVVPGYHGADQNPDRLKAEAERTGYPLLIKARAGGGGKGMRRVDAAAEFVAALQAAKREAKQSFGDDSVLLERYIQNPRHIEFQILADQHGRTLHLFERDCSLQRRHQKVIEEAPAPDMTDEVRAAMGIAAVNAAKAVGYTNAGTVEFIADGSHGLRADSFYFMEMNTRLQVEHPVTEAITGLDLVELQIKIAAGEKLPFEQSDLAIKGHAFEARLYAEDVPKGFLPATGTLQKLDLDNSEARVDTGVAEGDQITPFYDPMIAKIITHGPNRFAALKQLDRTLARSFVAGTVTNLSFLSALTRHPAFVQGGVDTGMIDTEIDALLAFEQPRPKDWLVAACLHLGLDQRRPLAGFRLWQEQAHAYCTLAFGEQKRECQIAIGRNSVLTGEIGDHHITIGQSDLAIASERSVDTITISVFGRILRFTIIDNVARGDGLQTGERFIKAPMPGLIREVAVTAGQNVVSGEKLLVMEAMKMEQTLRAPYAAEIEAVHVVSGEQIEAETLLVTLNKG